MANGLIKQLLRIFRINVFTYSVVLLMYYSVSKTVEPAFALRKILITILNDVIFKGSYLMF